jgi:tetratricopeptide (TPR) repeat protein
MNHRERQAASESAPTELYGAEPSLAALYEACVSHMRAGRHLDAQVYCQQALALDGDHADTLHLMGLLAFQSRQYDQAVEWISRAIRRDPRPAYLSSLGTTLLHQGRREEALKVFDKAVQLKPDEADPWRDFGNALVEAGRPAEALLSFQHVLKLNPQHWEAANQCSILLYNLGRIEESFSYLSLCDMLRPNHVPTLQMRAAALNGLKRFEEALELCQQAHALDPTLPETCNNLGIVLRSLGKDEEALFWFDQALDLRSGFRDALHNKAAALTKLHRFQEAFEIYEGLIAVDRNDALAGLGRAHLHLLLGNFEAGWAGREARWRLVRSYPKFSQPMWRGNGSIKGKTIFIVADEGLGDTIQFVRYVPLVAELGARIVLTVQDTLHPLLSNLPGISDCLPMSTARNFSEFDFHCPTMSLPLAFGTRVDTIPSFRSYLPAPTEDRMRAWQERLGSHGRLRVGLVWSGNPRHLDDHNRSIPFRLFTRLLDLNATFISLQRDSKSEDKAALQSLTGIIDLTGHLSDFAETAALISCLDLVITVDTSVAHLSGALGCPTWTLLSHTPDYRWLLDREDSPWYPTMRLFRQTEKREWKNVLDQVRHELGRQIASFGRNT